MKNHKEVKNINDLTQDLNEMYNELRNGEIGLSEAKQLANVAGKIVSTTKVKIEYNKFVGNQKPIKYLQDEE